jgi:4-aminobutyrate aminotransferase
MWAIEHSGVRPDILISAKGLANGFPLSMIVSRKELMDKQAPGSMGGTYAGNAVACAAASAVLDVFEEEKVLETVQARSEQLVGFLKGLQADKNSKAGKVIQDIRGHGLMIGVQFSQSQGSGEEEIITAESDNVQANKKEMFYEVDTPAHKQLAPQVVQECLGRGMLLLSTSTQDVLRFIPPLTISEQELQTACQIFKESLEAVVQKL